MLHLVKADRSYPPEIVAVMTAAFDLVRQSLSTRIRDDEAVREKLAVIILRQVDKGERDAMRLASSAFHELVGNDRSEISTRSVAE